MVNQRNGKLLIRRQFDPKKYIRHISSGTFTDWLASHGVMRVGSQLNMFTNDWEWNNGVALDDSKFAESQPDGSGTSLQMYPDGTWDDIDVVDTYEFSCERNIS